LVGEALSSARRLDRLGRGLKHLIELIAFLDTLHHDAQTPQNPGERKPTGLNAPRSPPTPSPPGRPAGENTKPQIVMVQLSVSLTAVAGRVMVRRLGLPLAMSSLIR
jgi:hypothetical protein